MFPRIPCGTLCFRVVEPALRSTDEESSLHSHRAKFGLLRNTNTVSECLKLIILKQVMALQSARRMLFYIGVDGLARKSDVAICIPMLKLKEDMDQKRM